jgi:Transposase
MDAVVAYGTPLVPEPARIGPVTALGLDETLFAGTGRWRIQHWCSSIVDVSSPSQLLEVVPGRTAAGPTAWIDAQPQAWRARIAWGVLDRHDQIVAWHRARVLNGPTEAVNNLIKRINRTGFGFRRFAHYRLRVRPDWDFLATVNPAQVR